MVPRIVSGLVGLLIALTAINWITNPSEAAAGLGMPLLEGMGRSTQIGDFTSFFVSVAVFCFLGAYHQRAHWLVAAATILGSAALFRSLSWLVHGAELATTFISLELVMTVLLLGCAYLFSRARPVEDNLDQQ